MNLAETGPAFNPGEGAASQDPLFGAATGYIPVPGLSDAAGMFSKQAVDAVVKGMEDGDVELFDGLITDSPDHAVQAVSELLTTV